MKKADFAVQTPHNYDPSAHVNFKNEHPVLTVPDQVHDLPTMIKKFQAGLPISGNPNQAFYDEESQGINPRTLDLIDRAELAKSNRFTMDAWKEFLKQKEKGAVEQTEEIQDANIIQDEQGASKP